jgi:DNA-binding Lrp family transcriptional regulator
MISKKDWVLLEALSEDSRHSVKELAKQVHMPRATVFDHLKKLKQKKTIKRFTIQPDFEQLGLTTTAFIWVKFTPTKKILQRKVAQEIAKLKGVYEVHLVSGEWDILVKARAKSMRELGELIIDRMRLIEGVSQTMTSTAFTTVKEKTFT